KMLPSPREPNARGFLDRRGLIHAHSVHSHDACDDMPKDDQGNYDGQCDRDFREGLCRARHDFVFLTDHSDSFASTEYPETLLHRPLFGDELVEQDGSPIANWTGCITFDQGDSGNAPFVPALIQAGSESATMPIGLPAHVGATVAERQAALGDDSADGILTFADAGAVVLVAHTEDWSAQELTDLPLDGFEMYNLHANLFLNIAAAGLLLTKLGNPDALPHSSLVLLPLLSEDPAYIDTWSQVLASGARKLTTMGTDCHRNTFPEDLPDGQRIDSYERMMKWFSNHLLVESSGGDDPQAFGPAQLHEALEAGRLFGVFELIGLPEGFDYHGEQNGDIFEIGDEPSLIEGALTLRVHAPIVAGRDPASPAPVIQLRMLRATATTWEEVAFVSGLEGSVGPLELEVSEPGAYRAEVRMLPKHLDGWLGDYGDLVDQSFVWIYANPIYVRD
ncbi:MAG TPA: hypothetical protein VK034_29015, partial [Enhygromyxa sp.]|nr:hypothetical protein [Enhygromyxa sp.]